MTIYIRQHCGMLSQNLVPDLSDVGRPLDGDLGVLAEPVDVLEVVVLEHTLPHRVVLLPLLLPRGLFLVVLQGANSTLYPRILGHKVGK